MHEPVTSKLEEYLERPNQVAGVEEHLSRCRECREEVDQYQLQVSLLRSLRVDAESEIPAGFYARVLNRIEAQGKPSTWNLFGETIFAKRLAYSSLTLLLLLGTFLFSGGTSEGTAADAPESLFASEEQTMPDNVDPEQGREAVLVNLVTYSD